MKAVLLWNRRSLPVLGIIVLTMMSLDGCDGAGKQKAENDQLAAELGKLHEQVAAQDRLWREFSTKMAGMAHQVDPLSLSRLFGEQSDIRTVLSGLETLESAQSADATVFIDEEQLLLRIRQFHGEFLFKSWIDDIAMRNVVVLQHFKSTKPVIPGSYDLARKLWDETREGLERKLNGRSDKELLLKDSRINFVNKMYLIDEQYKAQADQLYPLFLLENAYEKPQESMEFLLNGQFRTGGLHTVSVQVTPVDKKAAWSVVVDLVSRSESGEKLLKSMELNPHTLPESLRESFTVAVGKEGQ